MPRKKAEVVESEVKKPAKKTTTKKPAEKKSAVKKPAEVVDTNLTITSVDDINQDVVDNLVNQINQGTNNKILDEFPMPQYVDPSATLIHEADPFKKIEMAGRTCYKSEANITKESSHKFVKGLIKHGHTAMIEHAVMVFLLDCKDGCEEQLNSYIQYLAKTNYFQITIEPDFPRIMVSANVRAILQRNVDDPIYRALVKEYPDFTPENAELDDLMLEGITVEIIDIKKIKDLTQDEFDKHFNLTCRFVTDRGVTHEMVRHRPFSFAQESTRYCNYSKDQFGGHLTFCKPSTYDKWTEDQQDVFNTTLSTIDNVYSYLTKSDSPLQPQQARAVLPNCLKTEIVITGPAFEWRHFFNLRSYGVTGAPHPDIKVVADEAKKKMNRYIKTIKFEKDFKF